MDMIPVPGFKCWNHTSGDKYFYRFQVAVAGRYLLQDKKYGKQT
jgi:hypothetical protein